MNRSGRRLALWLPPAIYAAGIFWMSSLSDPLPQVTSIVWDKALHAVEYAGLAFLLCRAVRGEGISPARSVGLALFMAAAYAASDEWHQSFVDMRSTTLTDWLADLAGSLVGAIAYQPVAGLRGPLTLAPPRTEN